MRPLVKKFSLLSFGLLAILLAVAITKHLEHHMHDQEPLEDYRLTDFEIRSLQSGNTSIYCRGQCLGQIIDPRNLIPTHLRVIAHSDPVLLPDAKVLVVEASHDLSGPGSPILIDLKSGNIADSPKEISHTEGACATALPDGRVLILGGRDTFSGQKSLRIWDPKSHAVRDVGTVTIPRLGAKLLTRKDGSVLVIGGISENKAAIAEIECIEPGAHRILTVGCLPKPFTVTDVFELSSTTILVLGLGTPDVVKREVDEVVVLVKLVPQKEANH